MKVATDALERQQQDTPSHSLYHEAVPATQSGCTDSPALDSNIRMCCSKEDWCVSRHSLKKMEDILGDGPLHKGELDRAVELKQKELSQLSLSEC